jgi:acetoin utilization deacetylase AcuC-like enzyme
MAVHFVYSAGYTPDWPGHVFPVLKYRRVYHRLIQDNVAAVEDFAEARPATREELLRVHTPGYLRQIESLVGREAEAIEAFEAPLDAATWRGVLLMTGGTIVAMEQAFESGAAMNVGGGFHHASRDEGGGFCFVNDVAVSIESARAKGLARRFAVIDCDLHQGNGTSLIFQGDAEVFTADIHQQRLYPPKVKSSLDIGLPDYAGDAVYLDGIDSLLAAIKKFSPQALVYVAGADPYEGDRLGKLSVTKAGLAERDRRVFAAARDMNVPVTVVLGGGYAYNEEDVVDIHVATARAMLMGQAPFDV